MGVLTHTPRWTDTFSTRLSAAHYMTAGTAPSMSPKRNMFLIISGPVFVILTLRSQAVASNETPKGLRAGGPVLYQKISPKVVRCFFIHRATAHRRRKRAPRALLLPHARRQGAPGPIFRMLHAPSHTDSSAARCPAP